MAAIKKEIWEGPHLGATLTVELFRHKTTGKYFVNQKYNNQTVNVGDICTNGDCPVDQYLTYLKSRLVKGNVG